MKACIVTVYNSTNCGSYWQAYMLGEYLKKNNIEVYYYKRSKKGTSSSMSYKIISCMKILLNNGFLSFFNMIKRYLSFKKLEKNFNVIDIKDCKDMDVFILGSDTIWNLHEKVFYNNKDIYFGKIFPSDKYIISYAASFANTKINELGSNKNLFDNINSISVRDKHSGDIISKISNKEYKIVCDPTLLFQKEDYKKYITQKTDAKDYILLYLFKKIPDSQLNLIKKYALANNKQIIELEVSSHNGTVKKANEPINFINYFYNASMIFTDTFHGVIFSVNFQKEFYAIDRNKNKVNEFMNQNNLNSRLIDNNFNESIFDKEKISYENLTMLKKKIEYSKNFINNNIIDRK